MAKPSIRQQRADKQIIKKHVSAIHIGAELTLVQRKMVNALLYNAYETLLTETEHTINTRLLCEMIGFDSKNTAYLKDALKGLMETVVEFDVMDDDGESAWEAMVLLPYAKIKGGTCTYRYERALAEKLYHPDVYSRINLSVLREMNSAHALILYENCHRYLSAGQTAIWELDVFRKLMAIDNRYKEFKYLKRDVIQPAVKEVNSVSNIQLELQTVRKGRSVTAVQFIVSPNPQTALFGLDEDDEIALSEGYEALRAEGIPKKLARSWMIEYGETYVLEKLSLTRAKASAGKIKSSRSGYLKAAIEEDYQDYSAQKRKDRAVVEKKRDNQRQKEKELERLNSDFRALEAQYRDYCYARFNEAFGLLSEQDRKECAESFSARLKLQLERKEFRENGWNSRVVLPAARDFWTERSLGMHSFEQFCDEKQLPNPAELKHKISELEA